MTSDDGINDVLERVFKEIVFCQNFSGWTEENQEKH
jgi:hypothetical protein